MNNSDVKVFARVVVENGVKNGKLVVQKGAAFKEIPALLFSPEEAKSLLQMVDRIDNGIM